MSVYTCLPQSARLAARWVADDRRFIPGDLIRAQRTVEDHQPDGRFYCVACGERWPCDTVDLATIVCRLVALWQAAEEAQT